MYIFYTINIVTVIFLAIFRTVYLTKYFKLSWLNPLTIPFTCYFPLDMMITFSGPHYLLDNGLFDPYYQYALLVRNVYDLTNLVTLTYLIKLFTRNKKWSRILDKVRSIGGYARSSRMILCAFLFFLLYVICFYLVAQHSYGIVNWVKSPRTGYQLYRTGAGQWYALAISFLSLSFTFMATYTKSTNKLLLLSPIYFLFVYLLGSKGFILGFVAFFFVAIVIRRYRYFPFVALGYGVAGMILMAGIFFSTGLSNIKLEQVSFEKIIGYTDHYVNGAKYYREYLSGNIDLFYGKMYLSQAWILVPRSLYPDKPYAYGTILVNEIFFPGLAERTHTPVFATTEYFADFGWTGVIAFAIFNPINILNGFLYSLLLPNINIMNIRTKIKHRRILTYAYILFLAPSLFTFIGFPLNIIFFIMVITVISFFNRVRL